MKPTKIKLEPTLIPILKSQGMNWAASATKPFDLKQTSYTASIEGLKPKRFSQADQQKMLDNWLEDPGGPGTFSVYSAPTDGKAMLLAAWMMQQAYRNGCHVMKWYDVTGGFECELLKERANISLLVLNNVGPDSSQTKKEKLRDLLTVYADVAKIVVVHGCDPYTFFTQHLKMGIQGLAYITNASVKRVEV